MALDHSQSGTLSEKVALTKYISGVSVNETAASTAQVRIRDALPQPAQVTAADGAAGNVTAGLHMIVETYVTRNGESLCSTLREFTSAGSVIVNVGIPIGPTVLNEDTIIGRRIYVTKAGAPATGITPTAAQWFLVVADFSTTLAAGMNGLPLAGNASITVASTTGFKATNGNILVTTTAGVQPVAYATVDATHFLGCTMIRPAYTGGAMATGGAVTQPMVGDNTVTTFAWNVVDASLVATSIPTKDTSGRRLSTFYLAASTSANVAFGPNVRSLSNGGGAYVEVTNGTVEWSVAGQ